MPPAVRRGIVTAVRSIGFIGTGALTAAVVGGLKSRSNALKVHLSPRSEEIGTRLVGAFPNVFRESSNEDVVEKSELVVLAIRPQQLDAVVADLRFRPEHMVVSFVATASCVDIARLVAPAELVCRVTPLPMVAASRGPIAVFPALPQVLELFEGLGTVTPAETEEQMMAFGCVAGLMSTFFELEHAATEWLVGRGVPASAANAYVRSMFSGLAQTGFDESESDLLDLASSHETPSGLNEHARRALGQAGMFSRVKQALTDLSSLALQAARANSASVDTGSE